MHRISSYCVIATTITLAGACAPAAVPSLSSTADEIAGTDRLNAGERLSAGQAISSGSTTLVYQGDNNLVLYQGGAPIWATMAGLGQPTDRFEMQTDCNAVVYAAGGYTWASWTNGQGSSCYAKVIEGDWYICSGTTRVYSALGGGDCSGGGGGPPGGYVGCFTDDGNRALPAEQGGGFGIQTCVDRCRSLGYAYAGSRWYDQCFCGNALGYARVGDGECNTPCNTGGGMCGGGWRNSIYATGLPACTPTNCAAQGKNCGVIADGCGGGLDCGSCSSPQVCGGGGTPNVCGATPLQIDRVRLFDTWIARNRPGSERCAAWSSLSWSEKQVFLTITHRLNLYVLARPTLCIGGFCTNGYNPQYAAGGTMLSHLRQLYAIRGFYSGTESCGFPPFCGSSHGDESRLFFSMDQDLYAAMALAFVWQVDDAGYQGWSRAPLITNVPGGVPFYDYFRNSHDAGGPHAPFDWSAESKGGRTDAPGSPTAQTQFWSAGSNWLPWGGGAASSPVYRNGVWGVTDPYLMEIDQDWDLCHHSDPTSCGRGQEYSNNYGDYQSYWNPPCGGP